MNVALRKQDWPDASIATDGPSESQRYRRLLERELDGLYRFILFRVGHDQTAAEEILRPVAMSRANEPEILNLFASGLYSQGRFQDAVQYLEGAVEIDDSITRIVDNLAVARAARAAELLAKNATEVKAAPTK